MARTTQNYEWKPEIARTFLVKNTKNEETMTNWNMLYQKTQKFQVRIRTKNLNIYFFDFIGCCTL